MNDSIIGMLFTAAGYLSVGYFFFSSGYGLRLQEIKKGKTYLKEFPIKRILNFYIKYIVVTLLYALYGFIRTGSVWKALSWKYFVMLDFNIFNGWYLQAIMLVYLLFYLIEQLPKISTFAKSCLIFCGYLALVPLLTVEVARYYSSSVCILAGLIFPLCREKITVMILRHRGTVYLAVFAAFCTTLLLGNIRVFNDTITLIFKMLSASLFVFIVLLTAEYLPIQNLMTRFLGRYSFEIYVVHGIFLHLFHGALYIQNYFLFGAAVYSSTIVTALLLHQIFYFADYLTKKRQIRRS